MAERHVEPESVEYIDCEVPEEMTLREWRCARSADDARPRRIRAAALAVGRATRLRSATDPPRGR